MFQLSKIVEMQRQVELESETKNLNFKKISHSSDVSRYSSVSLLKRSVKKV